MANNENNTTNNNTANLEETTKSAANRVSENSKDAQDVRIETEKQIAKESTIENPIDDVEQITAQQDQLMKDMLKSREIIVDHNKVRCLIFVAMLEGTDEPAVVFHGDQLDYTALSAAATERLRQIVLDRIGIRQ